MESGRRRPSEEAVRYFAERLGLDNEELLTGRPAQLSAELQLRLAAARHEASTGNVAVAVAAFTEVLTVAADHGLPRAEARALEGLARCAERDGHLDRAYAHLEEALAVLDDEPMTERIPAIVAKSRLERHNGHLREAAYLLESALERLDRDGLLGPDTIVQINYGLIAVYIDLGLVDRAAAAGETALALAGQIANPEHVGQMHMQVSQTFIHQGRWRDAEHAIDRAHQTFRQLDYAVESAMCQWARGFVLLREGQLAAAELQLREARDAMRSLGAWYYAGALASEMATVLWRLGRNEEALAALDDAWRLERESGTVSLFVADAYRLRGMISLDVGDLPTAEESLRRAFGAFVEWEAGPLGARTARALGDLLRNLGRLDEAVEVYRSGLAAASGS